jgi:ADP-ribosyl-[dinitrogen reductase] hydrolase
MIDIIHDIAAQERARGAMVGLAIGDALGAPVEFKERGSFPLVTEMRAGGYFRLPAGAWTDDTAMALCLADSLIAHPEFDPADMLNRFLRWMNDHENTSTGRCIGVGQNTLAVLGNYHRTGALIAPPLKGRSDGNGAIMRLAPVACMHWRDIETARRISVRQSQATHCSELSVAASDMLGWLISLLIGGASWLDALASIRSNEWHDDIQAIAASAWASKSVDEISSSGYVVHTLEAAMWAVGTTTSFEEALITAVNLGRDSDTVGAVAGQIAGARYGVQSIPERWLNVIAKREALEVTVEALLRKTGYSA